MELHSYAKRKVAKKWSIEHKRKLVEARIAHDALFTNMPRASMAPWKKVAALAGLDEYSVFFVRKQWSNMIHKYKQYKQIRLDNLQHKTVDKDVIHKISSEWEFFEPIHRYMTRKTTNLHSYAMPIYECRLPDPVQRPPVLLTLNHANSNSSTDRSDTNEDVTAVNSPSDDSKMPHSANTDHDFYTKKHVGQLLNYYADVSEDTQESVLLEQLQPTVIETIETEPIRLLIAGEQIVEMKTESRPPPPAPVTNHSARKQHHIELNGGTPSSSTAKAHEKPLSERDKYYRHKRRFNRRLERRFDSILNVFGQIVKAEYPNIDVSPIFGGAATVGTTLINRLFNSDDEDSADAPNESSADEAVEHYTNGQATRDCENDEEMHPAKE